MLADRLVVPSIGLGEFTFGIRQSRRRQRHEEWLRAHLPSVEIAAVTSATAFADAGIRLERKRRGHPVPANDLWIAALARQRARPIPTRDRHFEAVADLERIPFRAGTVVPRTCRSAPRR